MTRPDSTDMVLDIFKIIIITLMGFVIIKVLLSIGKEQVVLERICNICIPEPYLSLLALLIVLILALLISILIFDKREVKEND